MAFSMRSPDSNPTPKVYTARFACSTIIHRGSRGKTYGMSLGVVQVNSQNFIADIVNQTNVAFLSVNLLKYKTARAYDQVSLHLKNL